MDVLWPFEHRHFRFISPWRVYAVLGILYELFKLFMRKDNGWLHFYWKYDKIGYNLVTTQSEER